jgi:hypothetical protein
MKQLNEFLNETRKFNITNEQQTKRYTVGIFHKDGYIDSVSGDGLMDDFSSYKAAENQAKEYYKDDNDYIYVVMDEKPVEPFPIFVIGKETSEFKKWINKIKKG